MHRQFRPLPVMRLWHNPQCGLPSFKAPPPLGHEVTLVYGNQIVSQPDHVTVLQFPINPIQCATECSQFEAGEWQYGPGAQ